jgi:hypothetical protein
MSKPDGTASGTIPVVIYAAKSSDDVHGSIPMQIADCRAAIEHAGDRVSADDVEVKAGRLRVERSYGAAGCEFRPPEGRQGP